MKDFFWWGGGGVVKYMIFEIFGGVRQVWQVILEFVYTTLGTTDYEICCAHPSGHF